MTDLILGSLAKGMDKPDASGVLFRLVFGITLIAIGAWISRGEIGMLFANDAVKSTTSAAFSFFGLLHILQVACGLATLLLIAAFNKVAFWMADYVERNRSRPKGLVELAEPKPWKTPRVLDPHKEEWRGPRLANERIDE